jgi:integrase/recombinase XerD
MQEKIRGYLDWKGTYAPRAFVNYEIWLRYFIDVVGDKAIEEYTVGDVVRYQQWLELKYNSYSVSLAITVIKNFFKFYKEQNYNCLPPSLIKTPQVSRKHHRAITEEEYNKIIAEIRTNTFLSLRDAVMIRVLWDTGVRVSELCDLNLTQITEKKNAAVIATKKTKKRRVIIWSEETHKLLLKYVSQRLELNKSGTTSALFVSIDKKKELSLRIHNRTVQRIVKYYVSRAGIKEKLTPHSFRHGWAHKRRDMNAPLSFIQHGLGHISAVSTFIYQNYHDQEFEKNALKYLQAV